MTSLATCSSVPMWWVFMPGAGAARVPYGNRAGIRCPSLKYGPGGRRYTDRPVHALDATARWNPSSTAGGRDDRHLVACTLGPPVEPAPRRRSRRACPTLDRRRSGPRRARLAARPPDRRVSSEPVRPPGSARSSHAAYGACGTAHLRSRASWTPGTARRISSARRSRSRRGASRATSSRSSSRGPSELVPKIAEGAVAPLRLRTSPLGVAALAVTALMWFTGAKPGEAAKPSDALTEKARAKAEEIEKARRRARQRQDDVRRCQGAAREGQGCAEARGGGKDRHRGARGALRGVAAARRGGAAHRCREDRQTSTSCRTQQLADQLASAAKAGDATRMQPLSREMMKRADDAQDGGAALGEMVKDAARMRGGSLEHRLGRPARRRPAARAARARGRRR